MRSKYSIAESEFICLQVSSFRPAKDHKTLLEAFRQAPKHFKLLLAGTGPLLPKMRSYCAQLGLTDRVIFLNEQQDVAQLYAMADVIILSSHYEGFGLAALEGMAVGKPVVASDVNGLNNLVGESQLLFNPGDSERLLKILILLNKDKTFYNQSAQVLYHKALNYDIKRRSNKLIEIYKSLV